MIRCRVRAHWKTHLDRTSADEGDDAAFPHRIWFWLSERNCRLLAPLDAPMWRGVITSAKPSTVRQLYCTYLMHELHSHLGQGPLAFAVGSGSRIRFTHRVSMMVRFSPSQHV